MQVKIGTKIKELRHRDGRRQEDLANTLGITYQAVSRWESGAGYPDMEMIPAIANYFNVSIDELFGYSKEREDKLKNILDKAEKALNEQGDMTECIEMLRAAADEFPSEPQILVKLGYVLSMQGWKKYGARSYTTEGSDYAHEDTEYNANNVYWQEEVKVFEKALAMNISPEDRDTIIKMLVIVYAKMGYTDKAKALASKQNSITMSRECLFPKATAAEEQDKYQGEAIIALLSELKNIIWYSVNTKISLFTSPVGTKIMIDLAKLYESVFSDGRCGIAHMQIRDLYISAASHSDQRGNSKEEAFEYFKKGFKHHMALKELAYQNEYQYTAPLVSKVTIKEENIPHVSDSFWKRHLEFFTKELIELIKSEPQFAECFE